jgi:ketosteroid isomerase-like protein
MAVTTFEDRFLIRELYGRYALAAGQQNAQTWLDCWSSNATWKTPQFEVSGQESLRQAWDGTWVAFEGVAAFNEVGEIVVSGDTAKTVSNVLEIITMKAGGSIRMVGRYSDEFVRENGNWRFSRRDYALFSQD